MIIRWFDKAWSLLTKGISWTRSIERVETEVQTVTLTGSICRQADLTGSIDKQADLTGSITRTVNLTGVLRS